MHVCVCVLRTVDEGLRGQNVLQSVAIDRLILLCMYVYAHQDHFASCNNVAMSLYDIVYVCVCVLGVSVVKA